MNPHGLPHQILNLARLPVPPPSPVESIKRNGAGGIRTHDPQTASLMLSQLSYGPMNAAHILTAIRLFFNRPEFCKIIPSEA